MPDSDWVRYKQIRGKPLPQKAQLLGAAYSLETTLKRDFYACTGVYTLEDGHSKLPHRVILKIYHTGPLFKIRLRWLGRLLAHREMYYLRTLDGIDGVPRMLAPYRSSGLVREYVPGCNLREYRTEPDEHFFVRMHDILADVHARGVSHNDLSKPENILVRPDGSPVLIDFQIATKPSLLSWPILGSFGRLFLRYMQSVDRYHLQKQHCRRRPQDFSDDERQAALRKGVLLSLHAVVRRPYRVVRHFVLRNFLTNESGNRAA